MQADLQELLAATVSAVQQLWLPFSRSGKLRTWRGANFLGDRAHPAYGSGILISAVRRPPARRFRHMS
jgi:hypothetical protein